jgi:hypothetical protein
VVIDDLDNSIKTAYTMIEKLGYEKHEYQYDKEYMKTRWYA